MRMIMRKGILKPETLEGELLLPWDADIDGTAGICEAICVAGFR